MAGHTPEVYQYIITLKGIRPQIWRRIQVPAKFNFLYLHMAITDAMGWHGHYYHHFQMPNPRTGGFEVIGIDSDDMICGRKTKISSYFLCPRHTATYLYDCHDEWEHKIVLERILPAEPYVEYPQCLSGERAAPPENCGGIDEYKKLLRVITSPNHREFRLKMEILRHMNWCGGVIDPERFNPYTVVFRNCRQLYQLDKIYQFKITLTGIRPQIWRRIQVPQKYSFYDLHVAITDAMGWLDYHCHQFHIMNPRTNSVDKIDLDDEDDVLNGKTTKLSSYFLYPEFQADYEYDFGDGWLHAIRLEKILPLKPGVQYPQCLTGMRACPPEDCGGVEGYKRLLKIIANPNHKEYNEMINWLKFMEWCDDDFNPEKFDPQSVIFRDPKQPYKIFQFNITLYGIKPKIFRRIQVPERYKFYDLHVAIADAMGWKDYHCHKFEILNPKTGYVDTIGIPVDYDMDYVNGKTTKLASYFLSPKDAADYEYDFDDSWRHKIVLEKILPLQPSQPYLQCLDGKRACPPEDCGGTECYKKLLTVIANPSHKKYRETMNWLRHMNWCEGNFNSEKFNPQEVVFRDPKESFWKQHGKDYIFRY